MTVVVEMTAERAVELMAEAVDERGRDYVYSPPAGGASAAACLYVWDDKPSCLVGVVLHKAGVSLDDLARLDVRGSVGYCALDGLLDMDADAVDVLAAAQAKQDGGWSWGDALDAAVARFAELRS